MRRFLPIVLLLIVPLASAQVYKWTDAGGIVHYSDAPPTQGVKFQNVHTTGTVDPLVPPAPATSTAKPAGATAAALDTPENRAKLCGQLQSNIDLLLKPTPVTTDAPGGKRITLEGDQRKQALTSAQDQYKQYCAK
jgi:Domain of unknown function (DUF4124)